ncbi:biogenesis of lysosome-related organelles complex 1 subunit 3-like [Acipenser oxyrinchus oxyrinchus]|uniref:Biogenesis of lysosome-related organelles complex 1 subunit 3 n=1 Tax=Acipenser oxyrinchus oxyrinchus TaxID=40147 RepID=A0AAD8CG75_ACIOX|nr:biogenesis of lysosome-related organelles complex 1 subunit 3-like [Acipenser oxyrinchus oxyrinchus]
MASNKYQTIVQGEASDSDEELYSTSLPSAPPSALKVPGEASETDSDEETEQVTSLGVENELQQPTHKGLPPLRVIRRPADSPAIAEENPALRLEQGSRRCGCTTLLQQKLRESNSRLSCDVTTTVKQVYRNASREIRMSTGLLNNSQNGIINASHSIQLILDDLKSVSEKMDIITSCNLLPDIKTPASSQAN